MLTCSVMFDLFKNLYFCSYTVGEAANSWMSWMDQFLTMGNDNFFHKCKVRQNITKLIDIYYDALDAPKQGAKVSLAHSLVLYFHT